MKCNIILLTAATAPFAFAAGIASTPAPAPMSDDSGIVQCIVFREEFRRAHPREQSVLLLQHIRQAQERITPLVAYTLRGAVFVHSGRNEDQPVPRTTSADLADPNKRLQLHAAFVRVERLPATAQPRSNMPLPSSSSDEKQLEQAFQRLKSVGVRVARSSNHLVIEYEGLQYYWSPRLGSGYNGLAERPALNGFVAGVLFAADFRKTHPGEKVALYLRTVSGPSAGVTATTLFTKDGLVFVRDFRGGDLVTTLTPSQLRDRSAALQAADTVVSAAADERRRLRRAPPSALVATTALDRSPPTLFGEFQRRKIDARLVGASRTLVFRWAGKFYSYDGERCALATAAAKTAGTD